MYRQTHTDTCNRAWTISSHISLVIRQIYHIFLQYTIYIHICICFAWISVFIILFKLFHFKNLMFLHDLPIVKLIHLKLINVKLNDIYIGIGLWVYKLMYIRENLHVKCIHLFARLCAGALCIIFILIIIAIIIIIIISSGRCVFLQTLSGAKER